MAMDKIGNINLETSANYQSLSDLNIQFWNQDKNTAVLQFKITRNDFPLSLSKENVEVFIKLESGVNYIVDSTEVVDGGFVITDELNGFVSYTIPTEFMTVAQSVTGQVYVATKDHEDVVVQRKFKFEVAEDLLSTIPASEKLKEIKLFAQLRDEVSDTMAKLNEDFANMQDYVTMVNQAATDGVNQLNTLSEGKLLEYNNNHTEKLNEMTITGDNYTSQLVEDKNYVDAKISEFEQKVVASDVIKKGDTNNWQKKKLTNEDGGYETISLDSDVDKLHSTEGGLYYFTSVPITDASSTAGYAQVETRTGVSNIKIITFKPYNSNQIWVKRLYNTWNDWERIDTPQTDTGWVPFQLINGAVANTAFKAETDKGFDCAYRIEKRGNVTEKSIRINASKVSHSQQIAQLPENFVKSVQFHYVRVPINQGYGLVGVFPSGAVYVYIESDKRDGWDTTSQDYYFYGEFNWKE
ncbi:BppU family phage baseplate upper protein [Staphylococcus saprophyticus]|uniref:BppU family phage baseplate upper protein n=1 Tax=Staphylococcus saprophyticus TaxID=29385 RepID=UPI00101129C9|nr:BppU family phage baseplate upper protein [Staphylococcus saprophyticus]RXS13388.1 phage baseplate upper protein [Staphylococcus saprophyticus]